MNGGRIVQGSNSGDFGNGNLLLSLFPD